MKTTKQAIEEFNDAMKRFSDSIIEPDDVVIKSMNDFINALKNNTTRS